VRVARGRQQRVEQVRLEGRQAVLQPRGVHALLKKVRSIEI
jgi:hypothetical protein